MTIPTGHRHRPLTAVDVFRDIIRIPRPGSRELVPLQLHPGQRAAVEAWDQRDPVTELPIYSEFALLWPKRSGKSVTDAGLIIADLVGSVSEPDREIVIVASSLAQAVDVVFQSVKKFVLRCPWLAKACRILRTEIVYRETVTDERTGGQHVEEHVVRSVPSNEPGAQHGRDHTLLVVDELHALVNYDILEALARPANRKNPRVIYSSYAGLKATAHAGSPCWDLWDRAKRGDDPSLFVSLLAGPNAYRDIPWVTPKFLESQRRQFEFVPAKYARLFLNEWASGDEGTFLTANELKDAQDPSLVEPEGPVDGVQMGIGVDLGLTHDTCGIVVSGVGQDGKLVVYATRCYHGSRSRPVSLSDVEDEIRKLAKRYHCPVHLDQWQGVLLSERLQRAGVPCTVHTIEASRLDSYCSLLKSLFTARAIRVPVNQDLLEQLEGLEAKEMRMDRVRFTSGPGQFDDLPMALCLSSESHLRWKAKDGKVRMVETSLGRQLMPEIDSCRARDLLGNPWAPIDCPLAGGPSAWPGCGKCAAYLFVEEIRDTAVKQGKSWVPLWVVASRYRKSTVVADLEWQKVDKQIGAWL